MIRFGKFSGPAATILGAAALFALMAGCEEDGQTVPARCSELPLFDIQKTPPPEDDNRQFNDHEDANGNRLPPCVTEVGHAVSSFSDGSGGDNGTGGSTSNGGSGGSSLSGSGNGGDTGTAGSPDAGAGGA